MNVSNLLRFLALALVLVVTRAAWAQGTPKGFIMNKQTELTALIKDKSPAGNKKVEALFDQILDYDTLARESLAKHWAERTDAERDEFTQVLKDLVRRAYRRNLDKTAGYDVAFEGETKLEKGHLIRTVARNKRNPREDPVSIDYLVTRVDGKWLISDIVTEGSSLVTNYRRQFGRIIKTKGFSELLRRMRDKLDRDEA
jgi:phospholipid transport system substrate-binding protein